MLQEEGKIAVSVKLPWSRRQKLLIFFDNFIWQFTLKGVLKDLNVLIKTPP